jgi:hypothetical protein
MGSQKRQAFSRGGFFRGFFEWVWDVFLGENGHDTAWGAVREATLRECITAPLARMSLERDDLIYAPDQVLVVRGMVCAQLEVFRGGKDPTVLPAAMPVTGEEPLFFLVGMALAGPVQKQVLHQVVTLAQGGCWNEFCVVTLPFPRRERASKQHRQCGPSPRRPYPRYVVELLTYPDNVGACLPSYSFPWQGQDGDT